MSDYNFPGSERWKEERAFEEVGRKALLYTAGEQASPMIYSHIDELYDQRGPAERRVAVGNSRVSPALLRRLSGGNPILYNLNAADKAMDGYKFSGYSQRGKELHVLPFTSRKPARRVRDLLRAA